MSAFRRKYGQDATIDGIALQNFSGDFLTGSLVVDGDVTIAVDGATPVSMALPASFAEHPAGSRKYRLFVAGATLACKRAVIDIVDQSGPKIWIDERIIIETTDDDASQFPVQVIPTAVENASAVDDRLTAQHGVGSWQTKTIVASTDTTGAPTSIGADLSVVADKKLSINFSVSDSATSDTTEWVFTVKRDLEADSDDSALIAIRNNISVTTNNGLFRYLGTDATTDKARASIVVNSSTPNTDLTINVSGFFMDLPAGDWMWELTRWTAASPADEPERYGTGLFTVERPVRRGAAKP